jgi:hypothetical protein
MIFHDYEQYQRAMSVYMRQKDIFDNYETARLAAMEEKVEEPERYTRLTIVAFLLSFLITGTVGIIISGGYGFYASLFLSTIVSVSIRSAAERFRRKRHKKRFLRRHFSQPRPVYHSKEEETYRRAYQETDERAETEKGTEGTQEQTTQPESKPDEDLRVTSMAQAREILGLPAGRNTMDAAKVSYRARMNEYHPDRVAHLGPELRELAARKALMINLAMQYIEKNLS